MKRPKSEIINQLKNMFTDTPTDEQLTLLEDVDDSIPDEDEDWEQKYNDLDKSWRQKYMDRFNGKVEDEEDIKKEEITEKKYRYSDLFKEE